MGCDHTPFSVAVPSREPMSATFELTVRCNLKCRMCLFRHEDCENAALQAGELTAAEWIDLARQAAEAGTFNLLVTGGEPMLRPDFCEIWEGIYRYGFVTTLYTNATLVTSKIMETLRKYPPHKIGVTIYGARPETYARVCGNGKAFDRAMEGIAQLMTLPSQMEFRTTVIKDNYGDFGAMYQLVRERFGCDRLLHTRLVTQSVRGACADVNTCRLNPEDNIKLSYLHTIDLIKEVMGDDYDPRRVGIERKVQAKDHLMKPRLTIFGCDAGMNRYTISHDGKLLCCQMLGLFHTDARRDGLMKAWEDFPKTVKLPEVNEKCKKCENAHLCNTCFASRYAETGDLGGCPEYVCKDVEAVKKLLDMGGISE